MTVRITKPRATAVWIVCVLACLLASAAGAAELKVTTSKLNFATPVGVSPATQTFRAYSSEPVDGFNPTVLASADSGNWLSVSTATGGSFTSSVDVRVNVNVTGLAQGTYEGHITITQAGLTGSPATVGVTLQVAASGPLLVPSPDKIAVAAHTGVNPAATSLTITNGGSGTISPSFAASTSSGGNWLAVSQSGGGSFTNSATARVSITSAALAPGSYSGNITVTSAGAVNSPLNVPVTLTVGATGGPVISPSPASLAFVAGLGANPYAKTVNISNTGTGTLRPTITASTQSGGGWLAISVADGGSFGSFTTVTASINIAGLAKGTYNGNITITDSSADNSPVQVPVSLTVEDPKPILSLSPWPQVFASPVGNFKMSGWFQIANEGTGAMKWTARVETAQPANWVTLESTSGTAAFHSTNYVLIDTTGLTRGLYTAEVVVQAEHVTSGQNPQKIQVTLAVDTNLPQVNRSGVVNGASFTQGAISPGEIISIFGLRLGPTTGVQAGLVGGKLPTELAGVRVLVNGVAAPLYYVGNQQINAQMPIEIGTAGAVRVNVVVNGLPSPEEQVNLRPANPGVFLVNGKPGIFFNDTPTQVTADAKAKAGDYLVIYATGLGELDQDIESGAPAPLGTLLRTKTVPRVTLGGIQAPVLYSGLVPGFVGLYQINIQVPQGVAVGDTSLIISVGTSQTVPLSVPIR